MARGCTELLADSAVEKWWGNRFSSNSEHKRIWRLGQTLQGRLSQGICGAGTRLQGEQAFHFDADLDPDPFFHLDVDPDSASQNDLDPREDRLLFKTRLGNPIAKKRMVHK
jgi:hypothetical protein